MKVWIVAFLASCLAACGSTGPWGSTTKEADLEALKSVAPIGRLSHVAVPRGYNVTLDLDPRKPRFSGTVSIDIDLQVSANGIWMHGDDLDVSAIGVTAGGETRPATWTEVLPTGVSWVQFPARIDQGPIRVDITYAAPFDANLAGLFQVVEQGEAYALAKSESIQARRFLPSFDEPGFKAPFNMTFVVPEGMHAIANTPEVSRETIRPGFERVSFATTRPLSTYLLSVAVGNFDKVDRPDIPPNSVRDFPIPLTGYARAGKGAELDYILSITPDFVLIFEENFQQPYPYRKLDIVAAPQWPSGATELAGAITYRESRILRGANAGPFFLRSLKDVHAHEIAHMWFGNLVTPPWWDDLWLKEGFAVWTETVILTEFEPEEGYDVEAVSEKISAMGLDSLSSARAVSEPIARNENIRNAYDAITYRKSLGVIGMVDAYVGSEAFRVALGQYIAEFEDGEADSADFFKSIGKATGQPALTDVFESFVTQNGVPIVHAEKTCSPTGAKVTLVQSRYAPLGSEIDPNRQWTIPVCVGWVEGDYKGRTCTLMRSKRQTLAIDPAHCPSVIIPNADGEGYYRFGLSPSGWNDLVVALPRLSAGEALASVDSAVASYEGGTLEPNVLLKVLDAALRHDSPQVLSKAIYSARGLVRQVKGTSGEAAAKAWLTQSLDGYVARIEGGAIHPELSALIQRTRAMDLDDPIARAKLSGAMARFLAANGQPAVAEISSDQYTTALRVGLDDHPGVTVSRVMAVRETLDDPVFENAVARALGNATAPEEAAKVRDIVSSGVLGSRETYTVALGQMRNDETREAMWDQLNSAFPDFLDKIPGQWRRRTPRLGAEFCSVDRIPEVEALMTVHADSIEGYERALSETVEKVTLCDAKKQALQEPLEGAFLAH